MSCVEKMDADCVIYNLGNPNGASSLHNLNLPNGSSVKSIVERVDQLMAINNPQADTDGYQAVITALGTTATINNTLDLLTEMANQIKTAKQSVANLQNYTQNQVGQIGNAIGAISNPAVAAGPIDMHDTLAQVLDKLGGAVDTIQKALPKISPADGNQLQMAEDGGLFVKEFIFPISGTPGNALSLKQDGYYVNQATNGLSNEQLMEMLINAGLNADAHSTLAIKLRQLITTYLQPLTNQ